MTEISVVKDEPSPSLTVTVTFQDLIDSVMIGIDGTIEVLNHKSPMTGVGVEAGDRIVAINNHAVMSRGEMVAALDPVKNNPSAKLVLDLVREAPRPTARSARASSATRRSAPAEEGQPRDAFSDSSSEEEETTLSKSPGQLPKPALLDVRPEKDNLANFLESVGRVAPGRCCIILSHEFNPMATIELASKQISPEPIIVTEDFGQKMRRRTTQEALCDKTRKAINPEGKPTWLVLENAAKSISLLTYFAELIEEVHAKKVPLSTHSKIFICCDTHPHFPPSLLEQCITFRMKLDTADSDKMVETFHNSMSRIHLFAEDAKHPAGRPRQVKINTMVDVVAVPPREALEGSILNVADEHSLGGLEVVKTFTGSGGEKFACVSEAGDGRFCVGSAAGNIYILDSHGVPLLTFNAHAKCIWDISFSSKFEFVTASEDRSTSLWTHSSGGFRSSVLHSSNADNFAVRNIPNSDLVAVGGLSSELAVLSKSKKAVVGGVPMTTSVQGMNVLSDGTVIAGGGNGSISQVDVHTLRQVRSLSQHSRKVPSLATIGGSGSDQTFASGSFDKTIRLFDLRAATSCGQQLKLENPVTGLHVRDNTMGACCGTSLFLWDLRMIGDIMGGKRNAWEGLARGINILGPSEAVTASMDGVVRLWKVT